MPSFLWFSGTDLRTPFLLKVNLVKLTPLVARFPYYLIRVFRFNRLEAAINIEIIHWWFCNPYFKFRCIYSSSFSTGIIAATRRGGTTKDMHTHISKPTSQSLVHHFPTTNNSGSLFDYLEILPEKTLPLCHPWRLFLLIWLAKVLLPTDWLGHDQTRVYY